MSNIASREELFRRAAAGAAFLDSAEPGWFERIDLGHLVMSASGMEDGCEDDNGCVLCQLSYPYDGVRSYSGGVTKFKLSEEQAIELGFYSLKSPFGSESEYTILDEAWREEVLKRRGTCSPLQA